MSNLKFNIQGLFFVLALSLFHFQPADAQVVFPFQEEVASLVEKHQESDWQKGGIVFTGSSSIRMWKELDKHFPEAKIINTGFGGSETEDLLRYLEELVLEFEPEKIFIYEGDNDVNAGKSTSEIMGDFESLTTKILEKLPNANLYLIGAKPSPSRWHLKNQYLAFNTALKNYAESNPAFTFIDTWTVMLDQNGDPKAELFIKDNLHMNEKGYEIWQRVFEPHILL
ncbi:MULTISPECIES: GDSL-type esterase/lipase family protein [Rhodonellum]|nr:MULTISPECIES: GDSL-type esterase/lipase family protein [Rhodonellum]SDZ01769.1 Lysophospholipase L1 [Rhodonellum ikkaensis]